MDRLLLALASWFPGEAESYALKWAGVNATAAAEEVRLRIYICWTFILFLSFATHRTFWGLYCVCAQPQTPQPVASTL